METFLQEAGDKDFESAESEGDVVDSDFSIDENDELRSDIEDGEDDKKKRKRGIDTKAYKVASREPFSSCVR